jgi:hypothetical protein
MMKVLISLIRGKRVTLLLVAIADGVPRYVFEGELVMIGLSRQNSVHVHVDEQARRGR